MPLDVQTIPGYVIVSCDGDTRVIAGVPLPPPPDGNWHPVIFPSTAPASDQFTLPPLGSSGGGISVLNINFAVPGMTLSARNPQLADAFGLFLRGKDFASLAAHVPSSFSLSVAPAGSDAGTRIAQNIGNLSSSVLTGSWTPPK